MAHDAGKSLRNAVWITFAIALLLVWGIAEGGYYFTGIAVPIPLRIAIVVGVTFGAFILQGSFILIDKMSEEKPLSGHVRDTLGPDRKKSD